MPGDRTATLQRVIATIQRRWGERALHILGQSSSSPATSAISTGFAALDQALGIGGLPRARMTELLGPPTSGKTTLALRMLAQAQQDGRMFPVGFPYKRFSQPSQEAGDSIRRQNARRRDHERAPSGAGAV